MNAANATTLMLARLQFAANISFHILFPSISIGLGWVLLFFKLRYDRSGDVAWQLAYRLWVKVFAVTFALGVVSGITMSFQFGTNWPGFMNTVGNIAGPLLAYEVLTAFFLEATFLGVMLYGGKRVSARMHTIATLLVAIGTSISAFWIVVLNAWMQTPAGFTMLDGKAHVSSWLAVVFNPSLPYRLTHVLLASALTTAFLVAGVSAYRWLRGDRAADVSAALRSGVWLAAISIPLQIVAGDMHGLNTLQHQPAKIAAIEGVWKTERGAPLLLFALPDETLQNNAYAIGIPRLASLIVTHDLSGEIAGLDRFPGAHPPVARVFWSFRIMVGTGLLMLLVAWLAAWRLRRGRVLPTWLNRALVAMTFSGWLATLTGWYVAEMGRQPWLVFGVLTTAQAAAPIPTPLLATTLAAYFTLYALLISAYISVVFYLARKAQHGTSDVTLASPISGIGPARAST